MKNVSGLSLQKFARLIGVTVAAAIFALTTGEAPVFAVALCPLGQANGPAPPPVLQIRTYPDSKTTVNKLWIQGDPIRIPYGCYQTNLGNDDQKMAVKTATCN